MKPLQLDGLTDLVGVGLDQFTRPRHVSCMLFTDPSFPAAKTAVHGFTSRTDSAGRRLHLGVGSTEKDWSRVAIDMGVEGMPTAFVSQVHGRSVCWADSPGLAGEADAVLTKSPGLLVAVRTADCVPIIVAGRGVVGAIHAGWRGLAAGIISETMNELNGYGPIAAVVGPSICMACYEVGEEVVDGIARWVHPSQFVSRQATRPHVDPGAAAVAQLKAAGASYVGRVAACTWCDSRLWSYRQDGAESGRQVGIVGLRC
jgi:hypothetical protein